MSSIMFKKKKKKELVMLAKTQEKKFKQIIKSDPQLIQILKWSGVDIKISVIHLLREKMENLGRKLEKYR